MNVSMVRGARAFLQRSKHQEFALVWLGNVRREPYRNQAEGWCVPSMQGGAAAWDLFER